MMPTIVGTHPTEQRAGYLPGLDGIRAIAVVAVVAYHLRVPFFDGGLLGVSVFFTLSGYLITSLLVQGFERGGRIELKAFWIRRARRLLPALFLMLPVVAFTAAIARPEQLLATLRQALYALLYVANWTTIAHGDDYFQRFTGPGPLDHLWSLAIEEQFYLVWPLLVFALLWLGIRLGRGRVPLAIATVLLGAASTWAIVHLYDPFAINNTRAYEGTDARAAALLVGALVATVLPFEKVSAVSGRWRVVLDAVGAAGLAGVGLIIALTDEYSPFLYRGGELALSVATVALAVAAAHPGTLIARLLAVSPLRWIGARSYGVYLWHLPVVAFMPAFVLSERPVLRGMVQAGLILALAAASFRLLEDPIRRRGPAARTGGRSGLAIRAFMLVPAATLALAVWPLLFSTPTEFEALAAEPEPVPEAAEAAEPAEATEPEPTIPPVVKAPDAVWTSCRALVHVGDSTSVGLVSRYFLPKADDQLAARYRGVGVERFWPEISGARSMVETYKDRKNATEAVKLRRAGGFRGCWVMALGTNDPANTNGNVAKLSARIDAMMALVGGAPVLWTTSKTLKEKGPYQNANMAGWNEALTKACARHSNMRVYDWATEVQDGWFLQDGIHNNTAGCKERAARIAKALALAFPRDGSPANDCFVRTAAP